MSALPEYQRMYKSVIAIAMLVLWLPSIGDAALPEDAALDDLRTPASPAFVLLGIEPSSVERPNTPKAFAVNLASAFGQGNSLPEDYAIEVAPYWLTSHPKLTFDQYYNAGLGQSLLQTLSFSLATSGAASEADEAGTRSGIGLRALPLAGKPNSNLAELRSQLVEVQDKLLDADDEEEIEQLKKDAKKIALEIQEVDKRRVGLLVELAGAITADFPEDNFDKVELDRIGLWITPTYRWLKSPAKEGVASQDLFDLILVIRLIHDQGTDKDSESLSDIGGRIRWQHGDFSLSAEAVQRFIASTETDTTYRLSANLEYRLSSTICLTASFGKDYDQGDEGGSNLISSLSVDFGFGKTPVISF